MTPESDRRHRCRDGGCTTTERLSLSAIRFTAASPADARTGLLGFVSFLLGGALLVDGVTLRRTREGRLSLSYPARRDRSGVDHPYLRPLDDRARREIEMSILRTLGLGGDQP